MTDIKLKIFKEIVAELDQDALDGDMHALRRTMFARFRDSGIDITTELSFLMDSLCECFLLLRSDPVEWL